MRNEIGVGIIGTGFMGKAHAFAYGSVASYFPESAVPVLQVVADVNEAAARQAQEQFGFRRATADWRDLVNDPAVAIVSITAPNALHREIALAAAQAGKHIHCEKPLAPDAAAARDMVEAATAAGVVTQAGFNYLQNPLIRLARDMIAAGELGEITSFRGIHAEDYMADPEASWTWRLDPAGGGGAIADLGSHAIAMARFLLGDITHVNADLETAIASRPAASGVSERRAVEVDDIARLTLRFARGCGGHIEANWVATGRKMHLAFEVAGSKGALVFTQERFNELHFYRAGGDARQAGFTRIEAGPQHEPYGRFCVAPGHQLGFNDLKVIEVAAFLRAIAGDGAAAGPDFREAWEIQKVIDAALRSSAGRSWQAVS
ncbi:putative dehydrogenase [Pseudochelatococcus lubricantis]|uniref:Dehydrogenase n=1 Tax=Pseudochelatococcus lubricantis TaxID=1538102 RepID=A0ABX0UYJ9_9HYPH|nr:Gfo/Idh/MocA family oxidoreductase [Pseudochelatococcus lubricantis]NIJ58024.1 putative dehydrogenase [Pseudochelatococcus lubricantis]